MDENGKHKRYLKLWEKHGWKTDLTPDCLEEEDRAPFGGGLRCFKKVFIRDDYGNTIEHVPKVRCKNPVIKKSLFCKKHGGGNSNALVNGKRSLTKNLYRGAFQSDLSDLFDKFLNDPAILDIRPELAALRTCFVKWVTELEKPKSERGYKQVMRVIKRMCADQDINDHQKFMQIRDFCMQQSSITDGESMDRLLKIVETTSRVIDRVNRVQSRDEFMLTPDGLKVLFRCITDILKDNLAPEILKKVKGELIEVSVRTKGDLSKYSNEDISLAKR